MGGLHEGTTIWVEHVSSLNLAREGRPLCNPARDPQLWTVDRRILPLLVTLHHKHFDCSNHDRPSRYRAAAAVSDGQVRMWNGRFACGDLDGWMDRRQSQIFDSVAFRLVHPSDRPSALCLFVFGCSTIWWLDGVRSETLRRDLVQVLHRYVRPFLSNFCKRLAVHFHPALGPRCL